MKKHYLIVFLLIFSFQLKSQTLPEQFSLVEYTPKITSQVGTNCYAYASAYVNLTTQIAFKNNGRNPTADVALSFGFVDGTVQYLQKQLGKKNFIKLVADSLYEGNSDGINNLDYAFFALYKYGTTTFSTFPYRDAKEIKTYFDPTLLSDRTLFKISIPTEVYNPDDSFTESKLNNFKKYISSGIPIIISVDQPMADCDWDKIRTYDPDPNDQDGNHIVNIIGYTAKEFIIKNNYDIDCILSASFSDVFKILRWAYVIERAN